MNRHFCTCDDLKCPFNPNNADGSQKDCSLCIQKCLKHKEIPSCFFKDIHPDTSSQTDYTYEGFCEYLKKHKTTEK